MSQNTVDSVEQVLRDELAHGDAMLATARPILRHLLVNDDNGLFSDEMIARIRGMMLDVAAQLLFAEAEAREAPDCAAFVGARQDDLAQLLFEDAAFLAHAHAVALEAQLAERLQARSGVDSALSPLVQAQVAGKDAGMAALAMAVLAAQARFLQHFRRMELPLRELPGDLFHRSLLLLRSQTPDDDEAAATEQRLRAAYDEGASRLGLIARLVMGLGAEAGRALSIDHAGLAIFTTALAMASGQERDLAVLSFADRQFARLALGLRAAGLVPQAIEAQFLFIHPDVSLPAGFELVRADRAAALLAASRTEHAL